MGANGGKPGQVPTEFVIQGHPRVRGVYQIQPDITNDGKPVYSAGGNKFLFYVDATKEWKVGNDYTSGKGWLKSKGGADLGNITGWQINSAAGQAAGWSDAPLIKATARQWGVIEPPKPTLQSASAKMETQVQKLDEKILKADQEMRALIAKQGTDATAKARAMQALKRKKMYETQRDQIINQQFNIEALAFQQEQAETTAVAVEAMKAGRDQLKAAQANVNADTVADLMDEIQEAQMDMQEVNEALAAVGQGVGTGVDDADLEAEWERMQEEAAQEALMGGALGVAMPSAPAPVQAAPAAAAPSAPARVAATAMPV